MDGHRGMAEHRHSHTGLGKTDDDKEVLRNTLSYRKYPFSSFSSVSLSVKIKLHRKVGKEGNCILSKGGVITSSYSSEDGDGLSLPARQRF